MGCSVRYLHRAFDGECVTLQRYILQARLDHSRRLLSLDTHRNRAIAEIAFQCGFSSSSQSSRQFRDRLKMTPCDMQFSGLA
ncbi:helix-turn-helix domain-containing protein [Cypionkella sp. TWP1-2-1b2]|uniref:helix-turn-helix domain-containing protein n=1 Tax=Cypionkella sp. TWP1-2-1b2 TaxID=2804675 RepID=UPI003CE79B62